MSNLKFACRLAVILCLLGAIFAFSMAWFAEGINDDSQTQHPAHVLSFEAYQKYLDEKHEGDMELVGVYGVTKEFQKKVGAEWVPITVDHDGGGISWHLPLTCDIAPVRIIDGDTFKAATITTISPTLEVTELTSFRLLGVDTPERGEEGYQEAKDYLQKMIGGKLIHVSLKSGHGKKRDSFGRFLVDIVLCTKNIYVDINRQIIRKGLGKEYPR